MALISKISPELKEKIRMDLEDEVHPDSHSLKELAWNTVKHRFPEDEFTPGAIAVAKAYTESYAGSEEHRRGYASYH